MRERLELYCIAFENRAGRVLLRPQSAAVINIMPSGKRTSGLAAASWADPPLLAAHADTLRAHDRHYKYAVSDIGNLKDFCFADGLQTFGLHRDRTNGGWHYREWAPAATACSLVGDFNSWDPTRHPCRVNADGVFYVFVPDHDGLRPGSRYKRQRRTGTRSALRHSRSQPTL